MDGSRAIAWAALLGVMLAGAGMGSGCGGGADSGSETALAFQDMVFHGAVPIVARVGNVDVEASLQGTLEVGADTGLVTGQAVATFADTSQVVLAFQDSNATIQAGTTTILIGNDATDAVVVAGVASSLAALAQGAFDQLQLVGFPGGLDEEHRGFAAYWVLRYAWAWVVNTMAARQRPRSEVPMWLKIECATTVPIVLLIMFNGGCAQLEAACASGAKEITIGGLRVPCAWILAMCVNGQYVGGANAYAAWDLLSG